MQVGGNRNARNCPVGPDGKRGWSFGLFGCFGRCGLCTLDPDQNAAIFPHADQRLTLPLSRRLLGHLVPVRGL